MDKNDIPSMCIVLELDPSKSLYYVHPKYGVCSCHIDLIGKAPGTDRTLYRARTDGHQEEIIEFTASDVGGTVFTTRLDAEAARLRTGGEPAKPFNLNLTFDGNGLAADYNDGSDIEYDLVSNREELVAAIVRHLEAAMSPEEE